MANKPMKTYRSQVEKQGDKWTAELLQGVLNALDSRKLLDSAYDRKEMAAIKNEVMNDLTRVVEGTAAAEPTTVEPLQTLSPSPLYANLSSLGETEQEQDSEVQEEEQAVTEPTPEVHEKEEPVVEQEQASPEHVEEVEVEEKEEPVQAQVESKEDTAVKKVSKQASAPGAGDIVSNLAKARQQRKREEAEEKRLVDKRRAEKLKREEEEREAHALRQKAAEDAAAEKDRKLQEKKQKFSNSPKGAAPTVNRRPSEGHDRPKNLRPSAGSYRQKTHRKPSNRKRINAPKVPVQLTVEIPPSIPVSVLAQKMKIKVEEVIIKLKEIGSEAARANDVLNQDDAFILVDAMNHVPVEVSVQSPEEKLLTSYIYSDIETPPTRPPIVTVMGHVDHGKTTLLDTIKKTATAAGEAGGITQAIGAYSAKHKNTTMTFIDTPGHVAFSEMRSMGASITDLVILVVAANDGVMPQTVEAIEHAQHANVPIIVAINKMDLPDVNLTRLRDGLNRYGLQGEEWGGNTQMVEISAKTGKGIDDLLETVQINAELLELTAVQDGPAQAVVVESTVDPKMGQKTSVILLKGTLTQGDTILTENSIDKVRSITNSDGKVIKTAGPSTPVMLMGVKEPPTPGSLVLASPSKKGMKLLSEVLTDRESRAKALKGVTKKQSLTELFASAKAKENQEESKKKTLLVKADTQGSLQAILGSIEAMKDDEVNFDILSQGIGAINDSDVTLAASFGALMVGFNVRLDRQAEKRLGAPGPDGYDNVIYSSIIYELLEELEAILLGLKSPEQKEELFGSAEVLQVFKASGFGQVAGCLIQSGTVYKEKPVRIIRDGKVIYTGELDSLRRVKDDVKEVRSGTECGIGVKNYENIRPGDIIENYQIIESKSTSLNQASA